MLVLLSGPASASHIANLSIPFENLLLINPCNLELFLAEGSIHLNIHTSDGGLSVEVNLQGVSGGPGTQGNDYQVALNVNARVLNPPPVVILEVPVNIVSHGTAQNARAHVQVHVNTSPPFINIGGVTPPITCSG